MVEPQQTSFPSPKLQWERQQFLYISLCWGERVLEIGFHYGSWAAQSASASPSPKFLYKTTLVTFLPTSHRQSLCHFVSHVRFSMTSDLLNPTHYNRSFKVSSVPTSLPRSFSGRNYWKGFCLYKMRSSLLPSSVTNLALLNWLHCFHHKHQCPKLG